MDSIASGIVFFDGAIGQSEHNSIESTGCAINCVRTAKIRHIKIFALAGRDPKWDQVQPDTLKTGAAPRTAAQHFRPPEAAAERLKLLCIIRQFQSFRVRGGWRSRRPSPPGALYSPFLTRRGGGDIEAQNVCQPTQKFRSQDHKHTKEVSMPRYIAYCRKSRDEADKQVLSIEAQIAEITEFAKREHLEIVEFVTESKTAKCPGREKFGEVIKKIEHGVADGIIAWHADRLARNSVDGGRLIYLLDTGKLVDLKFPTLWFENTPQGKFMLSIAFGQSKYYVDNLSQNVKRGLRQKIRNGVWPGKAPYGYVNNPRTRGIDLELAQSRAIKRAYEFFASGGSTFTDLARYLKKFGLTRKNGKPLHIGEIRQILANKFYIGIMHYQDEYHEGKHEQFISHDLFKRVQEELARRSRSKQKSHRFDFVGLAKCGHCGAAITAEEHTKYYKTTNRRATYVYYRCTRKMGVCHQGAITHQDFVDYLQGLAADISIPETWGEKWQELLSQDEQQAKLESAANVAILEKSVAEIDQKLNTLLDSYLDSVVDPATYKHKKQELSERKQKFVEQITEIRDKGAEWVEPMRDLIMCAISSHKIARAKNNGEELSSFAKRVGLNFILEDRRLRGELKRGYTALQAGRGAWSANHLEPENSEIVESQRHSLNF